MNVDGVSVVDGGFYWAMVDASTRWHRVKPALQVVLAVITDEGRLYWEACGTDEGALVMRVVSRAEPPA